MSPRLGPTVAHATLRRALCGLKCVVSVSALRQAPAPHRAVTPCAGFLSPLAPTLHLLRDGQVWVWSVHRSGSLVPHAKKVPAVPTPDPGHQGVSVGFQGPNWVHCGQTAQCPGILHQQLPSAAAVGGCVSPEGTGARAHPSS